MFRIFAVAFVALSLLTSTALADTLYGTCKYKDGSKADGTVKISTSWNGKKAFPKKGEYELDFGGKVGKKITIYVNGSKYTTITVKGRTKLDITVRK
ncbi:MAG: hypothetical protein H8E37_12665 [Planctomycetes bacterium]|nr:hypothetical protein [Planctomycetota bacterium]